MSLHTWHCQGPHKPSSCTTFTFNIHWGRAATAKKKKKKILHLCAEGHFSHVQILCDPVDCGLPGFLVRERGSPGKNTEAIGQDWLPYPSRALYFLLPKLATPLSTGAVRAPVTQAAAPPPHLALTGANPSPPGKPEEQTPVDDPCVEEEIKPQLKSRGKLAKEEDPKPSHQLYKLQTKSTGSTRKTLCLWNL